MKTNKQILIALGQDNCVVHKKFTNFEDSFEQCLVYVAYPAVLATGKVEKNGVSHPDQLVEDVVRIYPG